MADAKLIVKRLIEEPWKGNWDVIDEYAAPGYLVVTQFLSQPASLIEATVPSAEECHVVVVTLYRCGE